MGWIVVGIVLFVGYAVVTFGLAGLATAMDGGRKKSPTALSGMGMWLILLTAPLWGLVVWPINRLGYRVPLLGAPFALGGRRRLAREQASADSDSDSDSDSDQG